jgi:peptidoglycan-N-acetylglucosamine deacetylase
MRRLTFGAVLAAACLVARAGDVPSGIVTRMPTKEKVVALTFDACEASKIAHFDAGILSYLAEKNVPFTIFATGNFVRDNPEDIRRISKSPGVTIENHSTRHPRDMTQLSDADVRAEIETAGERIRRATGTTPALFRFPGGNADERVVAIAQSMGYVVVHWRWAAGDPDPAIGADQMVEQTLSRTRPGDILIMHINGRGWHTAEALPRIIDGLEAKGYRFVALRTALMQGNVQPPIDSRNRR